MKEGIFCCGAYCKGILFISLSVLKYMRFTFSSIDIPEAEPISGW